MSHTTDDLIFEWYPEEDTPLVVEPIQLPQVSRDWWAAGHVTPCSPLIGPQLELVYNSTADCTAEYSTGTFTCLMVEFKLRRRLGYFMFHTYIPTCLIVMMSWIRWY